MKDSTTSERRKKLLDDCQDEWQKFTDRQSRLLALWWKVQKALLPLWMGGCAMILLAFMLPVLAIGLLFLFEVFCTTTGLC